jgi:hypothetical protein
MTQGETEQFPCNSPELCSLCQAHLNDVSVLVKALAASSQKVQREGFKRSKQGLCSHGTGVRVTSVEPAR